ncbi:MAG: pilus assembly protein PilP [Halofilum sp. (in: g-proteobacteria)]|nr:pilus assembly protein PilP [Halofilum sp. (in: g-proteobacteria)]
MLRPALRIATILPALALLLGGCSNDMSDLRTFVEKTKQRPGGKIEPLPEFEPYQSFSYNPAALRDPFVPQAGFAMSEEEQEQQQESAGLQPDRDRRKEPLEQFPLDSLDMVGTLSRDGRQWGLVRAPDGTVHQVLPGNHMGQNYGRITAVQAGSIEVVEIVPNGQGGWMERDAALGLSDD